MSNWWDWTPRTAPWGLQKKPSEFWEDMYWKVCRQFSSIQHQLIRARGLEELNYKQARMLMMRDFIIRQLEEQLMKKLQEEKDKDNVIQFEEARLALASKEPPDGGNWLSTLPVETRFLAFRKGSNDPMLGEFLIGSDPKEIPAVFLGCEMGPREYGFRWFDPVKFSKEYGFYMTIKAIAHDNKVQDGRVDSDGETQGVHPVHEK